MIQLIFFVKRKSIKNKQKSKKTQQINKQTIKQTKPKTNSYSSRIGYTFKKNQKPAISEIICIMTFVFPVIMG